FWSLYPCKLSIVRPGASVLAGFKIQFTYSRILRKKMKVPLPFHEDWLWISHHFLSYLFKTRDVIGLEAAVLIAHPSCISTGDIDPDIALIVNHQTWIVMRIIYTTFVMHNHGF